MHDLRAKHVKRKNITESWDRFATSVRDLAGMYYQLNIIEVTVVVQFEKFSI